MNSNDQEGRLIPPPLPPRHPSASSSPASSSLDFRVRPPLPPRPGTSTISLDASEDIPTEDSSDTESLAPTPNTDAGEASRESLSLSPKDEEGLSEVQLRELYNDEEIHRFLHLFSTYVREVRVAEPTPPTTSTQSASASAPAIAESSTDSNNPHTNVRRSSLDVFNGTRTISEVIVHDFLLPLLPAPRPPPPDFTLSRLKQSAQRLYVAVEPLYSMVAMPLLKLATWENPRRSFVFCALYWILWYHGLLLSAFAARLLYELLVKKLHPYPSLAELREHRSRIDRSQTFGSILFTRMVASPTLGLRDMWDLFGDYKHIRKLKKAKVATAQSEADAGGRTSLDDNASPKSVSFSTPDLIEHKEHDAQKDADLKRLGLFLLNETADLMERVRNIFLWREPSASVYYGVVFLGWLFLGLLPARYMVRCVGFLAGFFFWHAVPVIAAIPEAERSRIPSPLAIVPTDTEYAMELISQRVARGLPIQPTRRRRNQRRSSDAGVFEAEKEHGNSTSVNWNKWGDRIASTKERAEGVKQLFQDGQWKQANSWKALNPLSPKVAASPAGAEPRIETRTFPAQLKKTPGLITLTETTLFFTPLLSSRPTLTVPLSDVTGVKKTTLTQGVDVEYTETGPDGTQEAKAAHFMFVASRSELFARLVSWGGRRWAKR